MKLNQLPNSALAAICCAALFGLSGCVTKAGIRERLAVSQKHQKVLEEVWADSTDEAERLKHSQSWRFTQGRISAFSELLE